MKRMTSMLMMAPRARNIQIVETISILEKMPTPTVAAMKERAEVRIDLEVSRVARLRAWLTSPNFLYS